MSVYNRTIDDGPFGPGHVTLMYRPLLLSSPWLAPHPRPYSQTILSMLIIPHTRCKPTTNNDAICYLVIILNCSFLQWDGTTLVLSQS